MSTYWGAMIGWFKTRVGAIEGIGDVRIGETVNPDKLEGIGALIQPLTRTSQPIGHGNGRGIRERAYPIVVCLWTTGADVEEAIVGSLPFADALEELPYDDSIADIVVEGETIVALETSRVDIYPRDRGNVKGGVALVVTRFVVKTEVK